MKRQPDAPEALRSADGPHGEGAHSAIVLLRDAVVLELRRQVPALLAVDAFGNRVTGHGGPDSDLDLAVLVEGHADPLALWEPAGSLADRVGCPVDLLDLRAASTVMQHLIRRERLGLPQSARDAFALPAAGGWIDASLADAMKRMVGFRDIAMHGYQNLSLPITVSIIEQHLGEFLAYSKALLLRDAGPR